MARRCARHARARDATNVYHSVAIPLELSRRASPRLQSTMRANASVVTRVGTVINVRARGLARRARRGVGGVGGGVIVIDVDGCARGRGVGSRGSARRHAAFGARDVRGGVDDVAVSSPAAVDGSVVARAAPNVDGLPVKVLVEAAMLAAMTGLTFHVSSLFRFDAYFGALFPLPVVIAAARWGEKAAMRTLVVATLLLALISGPLRALNYFCLHGVLAYTLGSLWVRGSSWWVTIPVSALTRTCGILGSLAVSSLVWRENVLALLVTQMYALIDQFAAGVGATFAPTMGWVWATAMFFILINSFSYTLILHMVYTIVLSAVTGKNFVNAPPKVCRALGVSA